MNSPSPEEFEAHMREAAAVADARALRTENKLDDMLRRMDTRDAVFQMQFQRINEKLDKLIKGVRDLRTSVAGDMQDLGGSISSLKRTVVTTVLVAWIPLGAFIYISNSKLLAAIEPENKAARALVNASHELDQVTARQVALSNQRVFVTHRRPSEIRPPEGGRRFA